MNMGAKHTSTVQTLTPAHLKPHPIRNILQRTGLVLGGAALVTAFFLKGVPARAQEIADKGKTPVTAPVVGGTVTQPAGASKTPITNGQNLLSWSDMKALDVQSEKYRNHKMDLDGQKMFNVQVDIQFNGKMIVGHANLVREGELGGMPKKTFFVLVNGQDVGAVDLENLSIQYKQVTGNNMGAVKILIETQNSEAWGGQCVVFRIVPLKSANAEIENNVPVDTEIYAPNGKMYGAIQQIAMR